MRFAWMFRWSVLAAFFVSLLSLSLGVSVVNSPDENANWQFTQAFSESGTLRLDEERNEVLQGVLGPRSMVALGSTLVPRSFTGLPIIYGSVGRFLGTQATFFLTPLLAVLLLIAWRDTVFRLFKNAALADVSAFFVLIHPGFWHYSARSMMHNVPFVAFLVFAGWLAVRKPGRPFVHWILAGACLSVALAFRTSEVVWVLPAAAALHWVAGPREWKPVLLFLTGFVVAWLPFLYMNDVTFGGPWITGYTVDVPAVSTVDVIQDEGTTAQDTSTLSSLTGVLLPFGFHEKAILRHVWQYGFVLYPWMSLLALLGMSLTFVALVKRGKDVARPWKILLSLLLAIAAWLAAVYGSWVIHDNPDTSLISVGNSYVRYWLPLFVLASVFSAKFLLWLVKPLQQRMRFAVLSLIVLASFFASLQLVVHGNDGFVATRLAFQTFEMKRDLILDITEEEAIIIVDRADKYLFPHRSVVVPLREASTYETMPAMVELAPTYYFGITFPPEDVEYLNTDRLFGLGLQIEEVATIQEETLYRISEMDL